MLDDHRDGLSSSSFLAWSSIAQSVRQQAFSLLVNRYLRSWVRILPSAEEDNLSPLDSNIACLCQSIEINNNKRIIMEFPEVITSDRSDFHAKGQGQRLKVKVTEVKIQFSSFRTVTPVWIHIWWWNYVESFMLLSRDVLLIFKVIRQILSSPGSKTDDYDPNWAFPDCYSSLNSPMALNRCVGEGLGLL